MAGAPSFTIHDEQPGKQPDWVIAPMPVAALSSFTMAQPSTLSGTVLLALVIGFAGCAAVQNDRLFLSDAGALRSPDAPPAETQQEWPTKSIEGIERTNWSEKVVVVQADATLHPPRLARDHLLVTGSARQRGEFPTADTVYELREGTGLDQLRESLLLPLLTMADAVMILPRVFMDRAHEAVGDPTANYARWTTSPNP